jgi:hypothetical protein
MSTDKRIDPQDNIKFLWIQSNVSMYREYKRTQCAFAAMKLRTQYTEGFEMSCKSSTEALKIWEDRHVALLKDLEAKYGTNAFSIDEETGVVTAREEWIIKERNR